MNWLCFILIEDSKANQSQRVTQKQARLHNWKQVPFTSHSLLNAKHCPVNALHYPQNKRAGKQDTRINARNNPPTTQQQQLALTPPVQKSFQGYKRTGRKAGSAQPPMFQSPMNCDSPSSPGLGQARGQPAGQDRAPRWCRARSSQDSPRTPRGPAPRTGLRH